MKKVLGIVIVITILFTIFTIKSFADEAEGEAVQTEEVVTENPEEAVAEDTEEVTVTTEETAEEVKEEENSINLRNIIIYIALMHVIIIVCLIAMGSWHAIRVIMTNFISIIIVGIFFTKALIWGWNKFFIITSTMFLLILNNGAILRGVNQKTFITFIGAFFSTLFVGLTAWILTKITGLFGIGEKILAFNNFGIFDFNYLFLIITIAMISSLGISLEIGYSISNYLFENKINNIDMKLIDLIKNIRGHLKYIVGDKISIILFNILCVMNIVFIFIRLSNIFKVNEYEVYVQVVTLFVCEVLGILYTMLCTIIAFWIFYSKRTEYRKTSENIVEGKRSLKI